MLVKLLLHLLMLAGENQMLYLSEPQWSGQIGPSKLPGTLLTPREAPGGSVGEQNVCTSDLLSIQH